MNANNKLVKIALPGEFPDGPLSPENISTIALYHLHYNLWDTLLASDQGAAVARSFRVSEDNLTFTFEIDPEAKFSTGRKITADDVKEAFDRVIAREEGGHINAKSVIRKISVTNPSELKIELTAPTPSFVYLLTTPEFAIVPKESLDAAGNVANLSITSGAYIVTKLDFAAQTVLLTKNKLFRRAVKDSPDQVEISFLKGIGSAADAEKLFGYDLSEVRSSEAEEIIKKAGNAGLAYKVTVPSLSVFMVANTDLLNKEQAHYIAKAFQENFRYEVAGGLEKTSSQFFPEKTFGSLSAKEIPTITAPSSRPPLPKELVVTTNRTSGPFIDAILGVFRKLDTKIRFVGFDSKEPVHYMFTSQGMNTDYPEIELHLVTVGPYADFNVSEETKSEVMQAIHEPEDKKRSDIIKKIGREFLSSGKVIPLTVRAYVHLFQPKRIDLNNITAYDGEIPLYRLKVIQ